jgi:transposase
LNEYALGETLDAIAEYGPTRLFTGIALQMMKILQFDGQRFHHDTTSFCVSGSYNRDFGTRQIQIVRGYSKDRRNDLKQFIISLTTNQHGIPVFMEPLSGNESDKKALLRSIQAVRENLTFDERVYHMADSAFYTSNNLKELGRQCYWISRVPASIGEAKDILKALDVPWLPCEDTRYHYAPFESVYADIPQKWVLFHSLESQKASEETYRENVKKKLKKDQVALNKLCAKGYACETDAYAIVDRWMDKHPQYLLNSRDVSLTFRKESGTKGRPREDDPRIPVWRVKCRLIPNETFHERAISLLGRFILASNDCDIDPETLLKYYKEQGSVERSFKFVKDSTFHAAEVYLKNENRIAALAMIMVLSLLVYSVAEYIMRALLKEKNATVRGVKNKQTNKPTMKRVFFLFRRVRQIDEIVENVLVRNIVNMNPELPPILGLLGPPFEKYYT